jgi:chromosome segregation ATPase
MCGLQIADLTDQLNARIDSQSAMHRQTQELQQSLQEKEISAQDLRVWIDSLEKELDQRGDTEQQLKGGYTVLYRLAVPVSFLLCSDLGFHV